VGLFLYLFCPLEKNLSIRHLPESLRAEHRGKISFPFWKKNQSRANQESKENFAEVFPPSPSSLFHA